MVGTMSMEVGALLRGNVRNFLNTRKFKGEIESFIENKSLLESEFVVKGEQKILEAIRRTLQSYFDEEVL